MADAPSPHDASMPKPERVERSSIRGFWARHHGKLWWLHSAYALGLGIFIILFAAKGYEHARYLIAMAGAAWFLLVFAFRIFGSGRAQAEAVSTGHGAKIRFLVVTYVLKNLFQAMLFFLLPFYWKSTTFDAPNRWAVVVLGACAFMATLDIVFDRFLIRWRAVASIYFGITLFACVNLMIPALIPGVPTLTRLLGAAVFAAIAIFTLVLPLKAFKEPRIWGWLGLTIAGSLVGIWFGRPAIPPVPLVTEHAVVGFAPRDDGRLGVGIRTVRIDDLQPLFADTKIVIPKGSEEPLFHQWRHRDVLVYRAVPEARPLPDGAGLRLSSALPPDLQPADMAGEWTLDIVTEGAQLVGRARFTVEN